jgi:putative ABC transport system permease protein
MNSQGAIIFQDIRFALRTLRRSPGFALTAVCTLALGIGANTAIFSVISGVLLRPLPFSDPGRLVQLNQTDARNGTGPVTYSHLEDWRTRATSFEGMVAYGNISKNLQGVEEPERLAAVWAERGLFRLLGVQPIVGRTFREDDPANVAVISARLWWRRFDGDPSCIGRKIMLDGEPYTVIGVMSDDFQFPYRVSRSDLWIPWTVPQPWAHDLNYRVDFVVARFKPGVTRAAAGAELEGIAQGGVLITPLSEVVKGRARPALLTLLAAVATVLLIACANVMNLLLARAAGRTHELAVRAALGASRGRIVQQLLTESVLLSLTGGLAGLFLARFGTDLLLKLASSHIPRSWEIGFDWRVFLFLLVIGLGTGMVFGLLPALRASRLDVQRGLKESRSIRSSGRGVRLRDSLMVAEIAAAFVLVMAAGLLLRTFLGLQSAPAGFVADSVLTLRMSVSLAEYGAPGAYGRYLHDLEQRLAQVPGVRSAGFIQFLPLQNWGWAGGFTITGRAPVAAGQEPRAELRYVSPGYFSALRIPILRGRAFTDRDTADSPRVILINQALALRYFPNQDPIGQLTDRGTIVGIAGDVRQSGLDHPADPEIYYSFAQNTAATSDAGVSLVVRAQTKPEALVNDVRHAIHQVNASQALFDVKTMEQVIDDSLGDVHLYLWLIGIFAALALLLAVVGVYSVVSCAVSVRTQEFAIRLALGAGSRHIWNLVLGHSSLMVACGLAAGVAGTLIVAPFLKSLVGSLPSLNVATLGSGTVLITIAAMAACLLPARRATQVDPNRALKDE